MASFGSSVRATWVASFRSAARPLAPPALRKSEYESGQSKALRNLADARKDRLHDCHKLNRHGPAADL